MKKMSKFIVLISVAMLSCLFFIPAFANEISPQADDIFQSAYVAFYSDGEADFQCHTYERQGTMYVRNCRLQKKNADGEWETVGAALYPAARGYNVTSFLHTIDFSSRITSGTYRVAGTFVADGYTITRYSSTRSF